MANLWGKWEVTDGTPRFDTSQHSHRTTDMTKTTFARRISQGLALAGLLVAGGLAAATPASATPANCLMTANPPVSLTQDLSSYEQSVRNANVDKCQVAQERAEHDVALATKGDGITTDAAHDQLVAHKVAL